MQVAFKKIIWVSILLTFSIIAIASDNSNTQAAVPGLPFTEDFSDTSLQDISQSTANWSTEEQAAYMSWAQSRPPSFSNSIALGSEIDSTFNVILGDVDGDGDLDLLAGNNTQSNKLYLNNGSGGFDATGTAVGSEADATRSVILGDVDGDGDLDLLAGNYLQTNKLYLNDGSGDFDATGTPIGSETDGTYSVILGDVDGDGDLDLLTGNDGQNKLYLNDGNGGFDATGTAVGSETDWTNSVILGDVDGDGDLDLLTGNRNLTNKLYLNDGSGGFDATGTAVGSETDSTNSIILDDVDGDGYLDLLTGNSGQNKLYLNDGSGGFAASGTAVGSETDNTLSVILGDVDGDGDLDLLAGNFSRTNKLYLNDGSGGFDATGTAVGSETDFTRSVILGDVDGDGDLDLLAGNTGQTNKLYLNDGSAGFAATGTGVGSETDNTYSVILGDVDGDGDLDLLTGNFGHTNKLYLNDDSAGFAAIGTAVGSETDSTTSVILADVDGDGDLDLLAGNYNQTNKLYLNDGSGGFAATGTAVGSETDKTLSVILGDVDGDGDLDLVVGNDTQTNKLYLNNGSGDFSATGTAVGSETDWTNSVILGDVDGDDDLDLLAGNFNKSNKLYLNDGNGGFDATGTAVGSEVDLTYSVILGDVDGDGDLDLVAGNRNQTNKLYLNDGIGSFDITGTVVGSETDFTESVILGDVDGDGDLDLLTGNFGQTNKLYLNDGRLYFQVTFNTSAQRITSKKVNSGSDNIVNVKLSALATINTPTAIDYYLSNNSGIKWYLVQRDKFFIFPTTGNDLRWRAVFSSQSPVRTARLMQIDLTTDSIAPEVTISNVPANSNAPFTATFTFSEAVTGFDDTDITLGNATKGLFTINSETEYTLVVNPTTDGNVTVDVPENGAFDVANNGNTAATQAVSSYDVTLPNIVITGVPANSNAPFTATFTFSEDVTGFDATDVTLSNATKGLFTVNSATEYTLVVNPIIDGNVTIDVPESGAFDVANNGNTEATQAISAYDATPPDVVITGVPTNSNAPFTATFTFSEGVTGFDADDINLGNANKGAFNANSATEYTLVINPTADGNVTIDVPESAAFDVANNGNTAAIQAISAYDATSPSVVITDVPANSNAAFTATFTFSEDVTGFDANDINLGNANKGAFNANSATVYTLLVNPITDGNVTVDVPENGAFDVANNGNTEATQAISAYDATSPSVVITDVPANSNAPFTATFTFSDDVTGFDANDINLGNANKGAFNAMSATVYTLVVNPIAYGNVTVDVPENGAFDVANNGNTAASQSISDYILQFNVSVNVSGLQGDSVVISNAGDSENISTNGSQVISTLNDESSYDLMIDSQPSSPSQTCSFTNLDNAGMLDGANVVIDVDCKTNSYFIGGTLTGLLRDNAVELTNNKTDDKLIMVNGAFVFDTPLLDQTSYTVTVLTNPFSPLQTCEATANTGTLSGDDVTNVEVICEYLESYDLIFRHGFEDEEPNL